MAREWARQNRVRGAAAIEMHMALQTEEEAREGTQGQGQRRFWKQAAFDLGLGDSKQFLKSGAGVEVGKGNL